MKSPTYSTAEIIGLHLSEDIEYLRDCRYQPTVYRSMAIYTVDDMYLCCPPIGKKPAHANEYPWRPIAEYHKRMIYGCTVDEVAKHQGLET